jgi:hypothetical protein
MSGQPVNLRPYGDAWSNTGAAPVPAGSLEEQALYRARHKLQSVRQGAFKPAGTDLVQVIPAALIALLVGSPLILLAVALMGEKDAIAGVLIFGVLGLLIWLIPVLIFVQSRPTTPKRALTAFYRALGRNRHKRARALTVQADLDSFPRHQPVIPDLGRPTGFPRPFGPEDGFSSYWNELLRSHPMPYCIARVGKVRETPVAPDVVLIDFELKLIMNTSLWWLLILAALLLAVIADIATRKTVTIPMRKVLVKAGDEWHLLSAEWQGYDEFDTSWLRA